jgi:glycosyltransferase involved in cell wall biosynthesis
MTQNVLLLCHNYTAPFLSVAKQYIRLFDDTPYNVVTVFLKGKESQEVIDECGVDDIVFCNYSSQDIGGLKRKPIKKIKDLHAQYNFHFCIAHRFKSIFISTHIADLFVVGVCHIDSVFKRWMRKYYVYKCNNLRLLGVSKAIRDDVRQALPEMNESNIQHLYNCLDFGKMRESLFSKAEARAKLGLSDDDFLFANVGRLHEDKDQETLIQGFYEASKKMPKAKLVIAGAGRLEATLKQQARSLALADRVIFLGMVPEVFKYLKAFDSFVLSSIREGLPVAILEAFAAELVCCASLCNGNAEAIESVGFSFPIGDSEELSRQLLEIYSLDDVGRQKIIDSMNTKIESNFTQKAVNRSFWELDFMQKYKA